MNIEKARVDLAETNEKREALETELRDLRGKIEAEKRDFTEQESTRADEAFSALEALDAEADTLREQIATEEKRDARLKPALTHAAVNVDVEPRKAHARAKNWRSEEKTYRPDNFREANFWADKLLVRDGDNEARSRLNDNAEQAIEYYEATRGSDYASEIRAMGTGLTAGGDFLPPLYLADLWVHPNMAGRPLADVLPKYPLPPTGTAISIPQFASGVSVAGRASGGSVSSTDGVTATISHTVQEYAGQVDVDRIVVMRSDPGLQDVITRTLVRRYNVALDSALINGSGSGANHKGLDTVVTGTNDITWTQASPTPAKFMSQILNAISQIDTNRIEVEADLIVMHGRRMAWGAQPNSSTFGLVQQSGLFHTQGTQDGGFIETLNGLQVVRDNNITTTAGAGTNQDRVYVLAREDFLLAEGPLYAKTYEDVLSGTGGIRFGVFAHSAFLSGRYPSSVSRISGTGLAAGTFDS